jgi:hypothetical protein
LTLLALRCTALLLLHWRQRRLLLHWRQRRLLLRVRLGQDCWCRERVSPPTLLLDLALLVLVGLLVTAM